MTWYKVSVVNMAGSYPGDMIVMGLDIAMTRTQSKL